MASVGSASRCITGEVMKEEFYEGLEGGDNTLGSFMRMSKMEAV
jgi:hypothetical protein